MYKDKEVVLIGAMSLDRVIGKDGKIPWMREVPEDLERFRALTMGNPVIMGRKTAESLERPLNGRTNIVLTRRDFSKEGFVTFGSLFDSLNLAHNLGGEKIFGIGGFEIYSGLLPFADRLELTFVVGKYNGDTYFPRVDLSHESENWKLLESKHTGGNYVFFTFGRRKGTKPLKAPIFS